MLNLKTIGRLTAWALLLCTMLSVLPRNASAADTQPETAAPTAEETVAEAPGLMVSYIYRKANRDTIAGCLENGRQITVLSATKSYYKIDCYDMDAYIPKDQVQQTADGTYFVHCVADSKDTSSLPTYSAEEALTVRSGIRMEALKHQGVRYKWGGTTPRGFDCSGFTRYVFDKNGYNLSRSCRSQLQWGIVIAKEDLQCGDLVFFSNTTSAGFASHVGIYIGDGKMIHASSKHNVVVVDLDNSYHTKHFLCARRVILTDITGTAPTLTESITQNINSSFWRENSQTGSGLGSFFAAALA